MGKDIYDPDEMKWDGFPKKHDDDEHDGEAIGVTVGAGAGAGAGDKTEEGLEEKVDTRDEYPR